MRILLTGGSGFIGGHIVQALALPEYEVTVADRRHGINFNSMRDVADWMPLLKGIDVVINCVGIIVERKGQLFESLHRATPIALFRACASAGVGRVIQVSALGADTEAFTPYQKSKYAADEILREQSLGWFVLRPSLVYGEGGASMAMFQRMAALPAVFLADGGMQVVQPVHVSDLVATVLRCLESEETQQTLDVVGPYPLTFAEWLQKIRSKQGKRALTILPIPYGLVMAIAHIARFVIPILHPDNLRMLQKGNTADVQPLTRFIGRSPLDPDDAL